MEGHLWVQVSFYVRGGGLRPTPTHAGSEVPPPGGGSGIHPSPSPHPSHAEPVFITPHMACWAGAAPHRRQRDNTEWGQWSSGPEGTARRPAPPRPWLLMGTEADYYLSDQIDGKSDSGKNQKKNTIATRRPTSCCNIIVHWQEIVCSKYSYILHKPPSCF